MTITKEEGDSTKFDKMLSKGQVFTDNLWDFFMKKLGCKLKVYSNCIG